MTCGVECGGHRGRWEDSESLRAGAHRCHLPGAQAETVVPGDRLGPNSLLCQLAKRMGRCQERALYWEPMYLAPISALALPTNH